MQTQPLVDQFLTECKLRGLTTATTLQYRWALNRLHHHCPELPCGGFDLLPIIGDESLQMESRHDVLKCLKVFFRWAARRHQLPNPCDELSPMPRHRRSRRVLTVDEVNRLLAAAKNPRDRALLLVVLDCGLRLGEVTSLRREYVKDGWLVVQGKSGDRQVPVSDELTTLLTELGEGDYLWIGKKGPLTRSGVQMAYRRMFGRAAITGTKTGPHSLRHTFATYYLRAGGGVRQLQAILGHQDIETTMIYVHLAGVDVQADHALYSPMKTMGLAEH